MASWLRLALVACLSMATAACLTIPSPVTVADIDDRYSMLTEPLVWRIGSTDRTITVPAGFVTDYASIPPGIRVFIGQRGRHSRAAVVHDFLYWTQRCSRAQADNLMLIGMREADANAFRSWAIYSGVNLGGGFAWRENRQARGNGAIRIVPAQYRNNFGSEAWPALKLRLENAGVRDGPFLADSRYCELGHTAQVP